MKVIAAAVQMASGPDKDRNLALAQRLIREAAARGAAIVVLPELFNWRGRRTEQEAAAEQLDGPSLGAMARLAQELRLYIVAGSITERIAGQSKAYNTSVLIGPQGEILGLYRKIHLFDVELSGRVSVSESETKMAGGEVICAATPIANFG